MIMPLRVSSLDIHESGVDVLVHDRTRNKIHVLNASAGMVLDACDGKTSVASVAQRLSAQAPATAQRDIMRVLAEFETLGLIAAS